MGIKDRIDVNLNDNTALKLCRAYGEARVACVFFNAEVGRLRLSGEHKRKNRLIHSKGIKVQTARNKAQKELLDYLDRAANDAIITVTQQCIGESLTNLTKIIGEIEDIAK